MSPFISCTNAFMLKMHATATTALILWYLNRPFKNTYNIITPSHFSVRKIRAKRMKSWLSGRISHWRAG